MKRSFSSFDMPAVGLVAAGSGLIAATYGLVRLAYGLFLPDVQAELSFAAAAAGLISSGASVMYCSGAIVGFFVASKRPRSLIVAAALCASVGATGMAASPSTAAFAFFAIVSSAGAGLASPGMVSIVQRNVPAGIEDRSQAMVNAGTGPGLVAAGILALMLLPNWRLAWFIVAGLTLAIGATVLGLDRYRSREAANVTSNGPPVPPGSWFRDHRSIILATLLLGAGSAAVWNYGRLHLTDAGAGEAASVAAWIALGVGGTAVIGTARSMSARPPRTAWTITTLTVAAATATLALAPDANMVVLAACGAFGWGYTAATGALIAWTAQIDDARAPAGTAVLFVVLVFGQALGAAAIGALASSSGFVFAFLTASTVTLAAAAFPLWRRALMEQPDVPVD
ncbi:MFS transporter [Nakamurella sp. GG22]